MLTKPMLGIIAVHAPGHPPFPEVGFFRELSVAGEEEGIPVLVFHPNEVNFQTGKVTGYFFNGGKWSKVTTEIPAYLYDRCFYSGKTFNTMYKPFIQRLQNLKNIHFLGIGLKGKWQLYRLAAKHPVLSTFLPPTEMIATISKVKQWLSRHSTVILKPVNGSLGIGILKVSLLSNQSVLIEGRDRNNKSYTRSFTSMSTASPFILNMIQQWRYLIQPYLTLCTKQNIPFDLRIFMQKDGSGQWTVVGRAIRVGNKNSITSNLHGGGRAYPLDSFLKENYSSDLVQTIYSRIKILEQQLPHYLEEKHGSLFELGIDVGIDQKGKVWLIETNSKPGRTIFQEIDDQDGMRKSQTNPLYYAKYLMQSHIGG